MMQTEFKQGCAASYIMNGLELDLKWRSLGEEVEMDHHLLGNKKTTSLDIANPVAKKDTFPLQSHTVVLPLMMRDNDAEVFIQISKKLRRVFII
jgi:hypothetical protein